MELENRPNKTYVGIWDGKFWKPIHEDQASKTPGVFSRKLMKGPNEGKTVHGLRFDTASGMLTGIHIKDGDYGRQLIIEIDYDSEIQVGWISGYAEEFARRVPNVDLTLPLYIRAATWTSRASGKKKMGWFLTQRGKEIPPAAASRFRDGKPDIEGLPIMPDKKMVEINGEQKLDVGDRMKWLESTFITPLSEVLLNRREQNRTTPTPQETHSGHEESGEDEHASYRQEPPTPAGRSHSAPLPDGFDDEEIPF